MVSSRDRPEPLVAALPWLTRCGVRENELSGPGLSAVHLLSASLQDVSTPPHTKVALNADRDTQRERETRGLVWGLNSKVDSQPRPTPPLPLSRSLVWEAAEPGTRASGWARTH